MIGLFIGDTYRLSPHSSRRQDVVHKGGNGHHGQAGVDAHEVRSKSWAPHSGGQNCLSFRWIQRGFLLLRGLKRYILGQWCGSVGRATTTSNTRDLQLESSNRQNITLNFGPFFKKIKIFSSIYTRNFSGLIECQAELNGVVQKLTAFLNYRLVPDHLPIPEIYTKEVGSFPVIGGQLSLICRVNVDYNTAHVDFSWSFPDRVHAEKVSYGFEEAVMDKERLRYQRPLLHLRSCPVFVLTKRFT